MEFIQFNASAKIETQNVSPKDFVFFNEIKSSFHDKKDGKTMVINK